MPNAFVDSPTLGSAQASLVHTECGTVIESRRSSSGSNCSSTSSGGPKFAIRSRGESSKGKTKSSTMRRRSGAHEMMRFNNSTRQMNHHVKFIPTKENNDNEDELDIGDLDTLITRNSKSSIEGFIRTQQALNNDIDNDDEDYDNDASSSNLPLLGNLSGSYSSSSPPKFYGFNSIGTPSEPTIDEHENEPIQKCPEVKVIQSNNNNNNHVNYADYDHAPPRHLRLDMKKTLEPGQAAQGPRRINATRARSTSLSVGSVRRHSTSVPSGISRSSTAGSESGVGGEFLIVCLLCLESFNNPVILRCEHAFCEQCLQTYHRTYQRHEAHKNKEGIEYEEETVTIPCPTCREKTLIPEDGLQGLDIFTTSERITQLNRRMSTITMGSFAQNCDSCFLRRQPQLEESEYYCSKCTMNFCDACKTAHNNHPLLQRHNIIHISNKETINIMCDQHNRQTCDFFCMDCNATICTVCLLQEHTNHNANKLRDILSQWRDNIKTLLNVLGPNLDRIESKVKKVSYMTNIRSRSDSLSKNSNKTNGNDVRSRRASCTDQFRQRSSSQITSNERIRIDHNRNNLRGRKHSMMEHRISDAGGMDVQNLIIEETHSMGSSLDISPKGLEVASISSELKSLRKLYDFAAKLLEMSQSRKMLALYEDIHTRLASVIEVESKQCLDEIDALLDANVEAVQGILKDDKLKSQVLKESKTPTEDDHTSLHEMMMEPQQSLLIKPKLLWGIEKHKCDAGELFNPSDIQCLDDGCLAVAEYDITNEKNNRLRILDSKGKTKAVIGQGEIRPLGVTCTKDGNIAVTDCKSKRIKIYTQQGSLVNEWGKGMFGWPYGIGVTSKGQFVVSDAFNDVISVHQPDGKRIRSFGTSGNGPNQFKNPYHITINHIDNIIVSDSGNNCFKVFDINGKYLFHNSDIRRSQPVADAYNTGKSKRKKLRSPRGIATDMRGNILVADDNHRVCLFNPAGKYVRSILTDEDHVRYAEAVSTNSQGCLAVTEWNPNSMYAIKMFTMYQS